jgi:hypothetical protein
VNTFITNHTNACEACLLPSPAAVLLVSIQPMIYKKGLLREVLLRAKNTLPGKCIKKWLFDDM